MVEGYGLTELSGIATTFPAGRARKPGSVGVPLGGTELRVRDPDGEGVGEVKFRGPSVIPGYWNDPEATAAAIDADGWLATGDMGRLDEDGDLHLVDRKKELIIGAATTSTRGRSRRRCTLIPTSSRRPSSACRTRCWARR